MRLYNLIKKTQLTTASLMCAIGLASADPIGDIIESTGSGFLSRNNDTILSAVNVGVQLYDTAETTNGRMLIEFLYKAELALTEHTRVIIDEIIYETKLIYSRCVQT